MSKPVIVEEESTLTIDARNPFEPSPAVPSVYVNHAQVLSGPWDMMLRLGQFTNQGVREIVQVTLAPAFAKTFVAILARQIEAYEADYGMLPDISLREHKTESEPDDSQKAELQR